MPTGIHCWTVKIYFSKKKVEQKYMLGPISEDWRKQTNKRKVGTKIEREEKKFIYQYISFGL